MTKPRAVKDFWDQLYKTSSYSRSLSPDVEAAVAAALGFFGDIKGKRIADLGCGGGSLSLYLAELGAEVYSIDLSQVVIDRFRDRVVELGLTNVHPICGDILAVRAEVQFDFVIGSMILHHIEPFGAFVEQLHDALVENGKAFFYENNANSRLLIWFRDNVVGKGWVPKHGDPDEFPLTPDEVDLLRRRFVVRQAYPEMYFFRLISSYLLRERLMAPFMALDEFCYRHQLLLTSSYRQYLFLQKQSLAT
jgi:SAM-dependent methyltransferase